MKKHNFEQQTEKWFHEKKGKVSGTVLKGIMGTDKARQETVWELLAERLTVGVPDSEHENPMDRGNRLEPDAIAMFELETGLDVERIGLCTDEKNSNIANSPDGLIKDNPSEAVEAKCMGGKNHVKFWYMNKVPDDYHWQVVQYFIVNEDLKKLYFIGYNPDIPIHPLHIVEVLRESVLGDIAKARLAQEKVLEEVEALLATVIHI